MKPIRIVKAFIKLMNDENHELAKSRLKICKHCPERAGLICSLCGCYLKAKVREEDEECPAGRWLKNQPPQNQSLA